jgi:hypothetical protein
MKAKSIVLFSVLIFSYVVLTSVKHIQDKQTFEGVYDGKEDYGYNFIGVNGEGDEYTMTFQEVDKDLLKTFDLNSKSPVGTKFSLSYITKIQIEKDEDGFEDEIEIYTIITLTKL